jgi:hypothetical protein
MIRLVRRRIPKRHLWARSISCSTVHPSNWHARLIRLFGFFFVKRASLFK